MTGQPAYGASGLTVTRGRTTALAGVSLSLPAGEVTAVVGGDGAGKTTLLRCLAGVLAPASGTVARPPAGRIGYLPASSGLYPDLTVAENLDFRASAYGLSRQAARERAAEYLDRAGLTAASGRLAGQLSGGMRQKLAVIAAMLHQPELLILDEPTTGVDPVSRSGLWWLIARAAADGCAVVLATSYLEEAERCASVLVLDAGRALASGTPDEIVAALPGTLREVAIRPEGDLAGRAWRRGGRWRIWEPGTPPAGRTGGPDGSDRPGADAGRGAAAGPDSDGVRVSPDLQDAVTVAALAALAPAGAA